MFKERNLSKARHDGRPGLFLEVRRCAGLVAMIVVQQNDFDVGQFESKLFNVLLDGFRCDRITRAEHDVALR